MINSVKVTNYLGQEMLMELRNPEGSGFLIFNMEGVGPEKAEIRMTDIVTADGSIMNSSRLPPRNITMSVRFYQWNDKTVEEIRHESYKYFPIKKQVTITITTGLRVAEIVGYVEANEPVVFSKETHTQLSILCPFPFFHDAGPDGQQTTPFGGIEPIFEFPFSNESLTEKLLIMGEIHIYAEGTVVYSGDADVGALITIDAIGPVTGLITLNNTDTRERMVINVDRIAQMTGSGIVAMDSIIINTVKGQKSIYLLRDGRFINILNALDKGANWFQLAKGDNHFAMEATTGIENLMIRFENGKLFEGV